MKRRNRRLIEFNTDSKQYRIILKIPMKEGRSINLVESIVKRGSGNVYEDLGFPDSDTQLLKSELVTRIDLIIRQRGLKQIDAANLRGPVAVRCFTTLAGAVSKLLCGALISFIDGAWPRREHYHS